MASYFNKRRSFGSGFMGQNQRNNNVFQSPENNYENQMNIFNNKNQPNFPNECDQVNNPANNINNQNIYVSQEIQPQKEKKKKRKKRKKDKSKKISHSKKTGLSSGNFENVPIIDSNPFQNIGFYPGGPTNNGFSGGQGYPPSNYQNVGYSSHS